MSSLKLNCGLILGLLFVSGNLVSSQWQDHPINCYTCNGDECASSSVTLTLQICQGNDINSQTCVTVFGADDTVVRRGCNNDVADYCDSNSDKCIKCSSNGCNIANALSEFVECVSCDSKIDKNCVLNPSAITSTRLCHQSCMVALYARNVTDSSLNYELSRSCLDDKDLDDREICANGGDELCKACNGQKCNLDKLPENRFSCYNCDGGEDCENPTSIECVSLNAADQCYRLFDANDDIVKLGCRSEFDSEELVQQIKTKKVLLCDGADCNYFNTMPQPTKCFKCDSATDENCLSEPTDVVKSEVCSIPYTQCYSKVSDISAGVTVRGCLSELSGDEFYQCLLNGNKNCQSCSGAECNKVIVPADRLQCQRCSSTTDSGCHTTPSALSICPLYEENDACVSVYKKGVTTRGCASEFTCDPSDLKSCQVCSSQGCNTNNVKKTSEEFYGIFQELPLKCYTCTGDECNESKGVLKQCEGNNFQDCVTVFSSEGKVISRGCEDIVEPSHSAHCRANPKLCFNCKSNECNTITVATEYVECFYCDSAIDPDCVTNINAIVTQRKCATGCVTALYPRSSDANIFELVRTCLDDVEATDVANCGKDSKCVKCDDAKCNALAVPVTRLSCNHCTDGDCEFVEPRICSAFSETDQCFMLFDETFSVKRMGCKSELTRNEILDSYKQLFLCNDDNCNSYANLPDANICAVCNSKSDPLCAVRPASVTSAARCQTLPFTQCYSKIGEDGSTARGCLLSLSVDDFIGCFEGTIDKCETCTGSGCNKEVFPANRQKCHRCSSTNDAECESLPSASEVCPLYVDGDTCVTKVVNGITSRDCGSAVTCGLLGRKDCRECSGSNCNTVDLIGESVGNPGLWQNVPIKCFTCEGEDCATPTSVVESCQGNNFQTCTTVFNDQGKVVARGCSDVVATKHTTHCNANPSDCLECKSNECNFATSKADYVDCIFCDGRTNPNCSTNVIEVGRTRKCHKACMTALYPRTSDGYVIYDLTRTCLDDKDLAGRENCDKDSSECQSCTESSCNTQLVPKIRNSCYHCSGESCQAPTPSECNSFTTQEQCFVLFDESGTIIEKGCKSDYDPADIQSLLVAKRLLLCTSENCNDFDIIPTTKSCQLCNSRTDPLCATKPQNVDSPTFCDRLPNTDCYTRVLADGHTERGCLSSLDDDQFLNCYYGNSNNCTTCVDSLCNYEVFPADRLACHTCNSAEDSSCERSPNHSAYCLKYSPDQFCVTTLNDGITQRGCSDELTTCDSVTCRACNTTNCNVINLKKESDGSPGLWQDLPLNCYICTGDDCKSSLTQINICDGNRNQHCMTVFGKDGTVIRRGCSDDVEKEYGSYCDETSGTCYSCNSNGCNTAASLSDFIDCIHCDSRLEKNCVVDVAAVSKTRRCNKACMVGLFPRSENDTDIYELSRSCLDDKDLDDRDLCGSDGSLCKTCTTAECNVEDIFEDRLECNSCLGESCESPVSQKCVAYTQDDTCFMLFDSSSTVQQMGCTSQLSAEELETNQEKLFTCSGNNCNDYSNIPKPQTCAACDSLSDVRCASTPAGVASVVHCSSLPNVDCYTRVKTDGHTARGCLSDLSKALRTSCLSGNDTSCSTCKGDSCNMEIFPEDRLRCHKCNSIDDPTCQDAPNATHVCSIYKASEVCSSKLVNGATYRGCGEDFVCDDTDKQYCKMCNSTNCNRPNLFQNNIGYPGRWQGLPINCLTCYGEECDEPSFVRLRKCENNNLQNCVTVFNVAGKVIQRGCGDTIYEGKYDQHCDNHPELCTYCKSSGCNDAEGLDDYVDCLFCDSTTDPKCTSEVTGVAVSRTRRCNKACMVGLFPRSENDTDVYELSRSCLDDKELDDRELCGSDGSLCKTCNSAECNVEDASEDRLECYSCLGESCESPVSQKCAAYTQDDTCFMLFDSSSTVQQMGCTSQLSAEELETNQEKLFTCSGNNCNDYSNIPKPQTCAACDSSSDVRCASTPAGVASVVQCSSLPNVDCYTRVKTNGHTARGCLSDLSKALRTSCLSGNDTSCSTCKGDSCNMEIFPEDRLRCHKCNSIDDPTCQDAPNATHVCSIYKASEVCSSKLVNGATYRGCGEDFICDDTDKQYCKMCNFTNCNIPNLFQNNIGYPGRWQGLPINCLTCYGEECDEPSFVRLRKCENNNLQNCVTVFSMAGKVVQRGCSETIYEGNYDHHCDNHPELCTHCKSSGCNDADGLDDYVDCLFCDSTTDPKCTSEVTGVARTRRCQKQCMTALYPRSDEANPAYDLARSCLDDKDLDERDECVNGNDKYCKVCDGDSCNKDLIPDVRLSCYRCSGDDCEEPARAQCPSFRKNDRCFILFEAESSDIAQMGCSSDLDSSVLTALHKQLLFCAGDDCNNFDKIPSPRNCLVCDSANDPLCATKPNLLTDFRQCNSAPYTSCYTRIENGLTKRGCLSDVESNTIDECIGSGDDVKCNVCNAEHCNAEVYPANRRSCHRCSSDDDDSCHTSPRETSVCPLYQENDECVVEIAGDTTKRGCTSEFSCNAEDRQTCRICPDDNCNFVDLLSSSVGKPGQWQDLPLKCYQCEGEACQSSPGSITSCSGNNLQNCMTVFDAAGVVVKRGCSDYIAVTHEDYCDTNGGRCQSCKSSACNNVESLDEYVDCIFCDTTTNPNCVLNPSESSRTRKCNKQCMVALYPRSSEDDPSYELSRSCLDDKETDDRDVCAGGTEEYCQACKGAKCNNYPFPTVRHQCWTCRGENCEEARPQDCVYYHPADQCYILFDNNNTVAAMGCRSEFERATVTGLIQSQNLLLCDGVRCNSYDTIPNPQDCIVCNSAVDPRCATNPNLIANATTCSSLPYTGCFTRINADGDTVRGCQSELSSSEFYGCHTDSDSACSTCDGNKCNINVFPSNRLSCHRCNSADDISCAESPQSNGVCPKITDGESCVVAYKNGVTHRGCSSELTCDVSNKKICRVCEGSGCNTHNLEYVANDGEPGRWQDIPISCYTCKNDECKDPLGSTQMCANNNLQNCMTVFDANGVVIQRGCSDAVTEDREDWCEKNLDKCYRCNSNGCNQAVKLDDYIECVSCDTGSDASCVRDPTSVTKTRKCYKSCMTALFARTGESDPAYETARACLDDKDLDDRDTCQAGSEALCKACDNGKCNVDQVPADRRSCFHCSGDGCQLPEEQLCRGYRDNDQCFYIFDELQTVVEMGCRSDLTIDQSNELVKEKRLLLCDGDNCNDMNALPASQSCALCNSRTDVKCAVNPSAVTSTTSCSVLPYTGCYSRVLDDGATERGCLSSLLGNDFFDCHTGNSTACTACSGASCNKGVYPANRISCHICDSASDPNCEATPSSLSICEKYQENESCVTSLAAGKTTRDCGTTLQCDVNNRRTCRVCTSAGCNTVDLAIKQDDNFGKWQNLPLKCFHCSGGDCQGELGEATTCENNNEQDCSTVFSAEGVVIRRGCNDLVDIEYEDYCDANSGRCFNCKSNECNTATALSNFTECISCDTNNDKTCVTNPLTSALRTRQCQGGCMVALYPSDSSSKPAYDLIRTCLNDKDQKDQASCSTGTQASCKACIGSKCNTDDLPANRLRCYSCLGDNCEEPLSEQCHLHKEGDQCFIRFDNTSSVTEMGCLSEFRGQEIVDILKTKQVFMCEGENCNTLDKLPATQQCTVCDSTNDANCAVNPGKIGTVGICGHLPYPNCYTMISNAGATQRGCLADLEANQFAQCILSGGDSCTHCLGNGCNRQIFPENRLQCYSCSSNTDPECESLPTFKTPCPYISDSEKCVSALGGNVTERGCSSAVLCDTSDKSTCRHCSITGCNTLNLANSVDDGNHGLWQNLPLRCHSCSGENCLNSLGPSLACAGGDQQDCVTVFDEDGEVIRRGCQYDVEDTDDLYCRQNPERCTICKSNDCNDAWQLTEYTDCIYCNSETDQSCVSNPSKPGFATRKCYKGCMAAAFTAANGTTQVIRTCLNDKELQSQYACSVDESGQECSSCVGKSCNNFNYPKDRLTCHICQGADCVATVAEHCAAYEKGDTCFAKYENGKVERAGCSSTVEGSVIENWKQEGKLYTCQGDSCNSLDKLPSPRACVTCDSSKNVACATNPSAVTETLLCSAPINSCFSNITNGATHRGCLQSLSLSQQTACQQTGGATLCEVCSGDKCNAAVYPNGRRSCHICNSDSDDKCKAQPEVVSVCPKYLAGDQCVVKLTTSPARLTERGCSSDLQCDATDSGHCNICNTDACNIQQLDNGAYTIIANNLLLTLLVAVVAMIGVNSNCF